ncbi:All-trans-nonaprenyl-diphosphate synthase (geranyl-diphosphate specific) [Meiothermus luteus]|jgi:octaprenyl-diphosphate synthase|uniref:All-trans-nonaprenyl-diphosphate synthase (Geranyl-diphosphate specific) n=1 Tax=Meiothermus luteus TaxID=2026184 RepID=A0A399EG26_9DEIN|nr:polyprenyl synthetase family protein [Meiothermus luteus]RIH82099.1 All-trans-nonaprenyl-diphosphate synthase (geranyl-diphosphate specific) [Meiothermus luteus]RMH55047.1 MAG: polyprenyl synthetase family protein [Deinococcota bacterium]
MSIKDFAPELTTLMAAFEEQLREVVRSEVEFIRLIEEDLVTAGGKRVRPRLVFLSSNALGGVPHAMELALAVELLHSASLLHDDLVDDAETRRGKEAAFRKYGNAVSVLSGDYLLSRLMALLAQTGRMELVAMFAEVARELSEAEVLQFQVAALGEHSLENYERIIDGKTASVMRVACEGAAVLGQAPFHLREALARFGRLYGQAFQMRDDYLDLMGSPEALGKPAGGDVREGKVTLITLWLLERHPEEVGAILKRKAREPEDIPRLRTLAVESGVAQQVEAAIAARVEAALGALRLLPASSARDELEALALGERVRLR